MNKRALVVDDEWEIVDVIGGSLKRLGMEVVTATSVDQAWLEMKDREFDLVVCDILMPGKDGLEFLAALRTHCEKLGALRPKVIIVSALATSSASEVRERIKYLGVDLLLGKPWHEQSLQRFVRKEVLGELTSSTEQSVLLEPICQAITDAISLNTGYAPQREEHYIRKNAMMLGEFTAIVNVIGPKAAGIVGLSFPRLCCDLISRYVIQKDNNWASQSVQAETVVGIANQFRMRLQDVFFGLKNGYQVSSAMIVSGSNYKISCQSDSPACVVPFRWQESRFYLELSLEALWLKG